MKTSHLTISDTPIFSFVSPLLEQGPLSTVFYFALSAKDCSATDPYHHPVRLLHSNKCCIFTTALPVFEKVKEGIDYLLDKKLILEKAFGVMRLSRKAFVASHVTTLCPAIRFITSFASQTQLDKAGKVCHEPI